MNNNSSLQAPDSFDYKGWRELFIKNVLRIASVLSIAVIAFSFPTATNASRVLFVGIYAILLTITLTNVRYEVRAFALLLMAYAMGVNSLLGWGPWLDGSVFFIVLIILSTLLFDQRVDFIALGVSISTFVAIALLQQAGLYQFSAPKAPDAGIADWATYTIKFSVASAVLIFIIDQFKKEFAQAIQNMQNTFQALAIERTRLEDRVRERTNELESRTTQLRSSTFISRTIAEMQNISELMETTARLTSEQFGYHHVGIYLLDERKRIAFLQAASSADGKKLIGQGFRIEPDRRNLFHRVIEQNSPYIGSENNSAEFIRDANFPFTHSRMTLPLTVRDNVIGILDLHSDQSQAFSSQDVEVLQTLADLVAISVDNARLISETKNLVRQLEAYTSTQTRETWKKFTSRHRPAYQYTPAGVRPIFARHKQDDTDGLHVPLTLHGQQIGGITLIRKGITTWSERERVLVEKVADQVALAIENSRLVDETQKGAMRDQMIANISARIRQTLDVESVLRTAATELRRVFDLKEAEINIGTLQTEYAPDRRNTSRE